MVFAPPQRDAEHHSCQLTRHGRVLSPQRAWALPSKPITRPRTKYPRREGDGLEGTGSDAEGKWDRAENAAEINVAP